MAYVHEHSIYTTSTRVQKSERSCNTETPSDGHVGSEGAGNLVLHGNTPRLQLLSRVRVIFHLGRNRATQRAMQTLRRLVQ